MRRAETSSQPRLVVAAPWVGAAWAVAFLALGGLALLGRITDPWEPDTASPLGDLTGLQMSALLAALGALVLPALAVAALGRRPRAIVASGRLLVVLGMAVTVLVSDVRALAFLGYLPMTLLAVVGVGPAAGHLEARSVMESGTALCHAVAGAGIVVAGVTAMHRSARLTGAAPASWQTWVRWGRPSVAVAVVVPRLYAVTRVAWALDIPLGVRREMLDELGSARYAGLGLALFAVVGAVLTWGLQARWGEVFWEWLPRYGGRRVPLGLALVPGLLVAGVVMSAGLSFWRLVLTGELGRVPGATSDWAAWAPELLWPLWGVTLAVACLAYLGRRTAPTAPAAPAGA